jgi:DNA replication protein DnaC
VKDEDKVAIILAQLRWLKLPGMARALEALPAHAKSANMTPLDIVGALVDAEKSSRIESAVKRRISSAHFAEIKTIDSFDFDFDPVRRKSKARYLALADLAFLERGVCPIFVGAPSTGKTFLARALAYRACQATKSVLCTSAARMLNELQGAELHGNVERVLRRYTRPALLVIDDFAVLEMDAAQARLAFQVISDRHERKRSTCITTNRPFKDWPKVFPDPLNAQIIAERLTQLAEVFLLEKTYRSSRQA